MRHGPDLQTSIRARGASQPHHEAGHTSAPDHMLITNVDSACIQRGVHTRPGCVVLR
jgi:hypothetical protein